MSTAKPRASAHPPELSPLQKARVAHAAAKNAWADVDEAEVHAEIAALLGTPQMKALFEDLGVLFGALKEGDPVRQMLQGVIVAGLRIPQHVAEAQAAAKAGAAAA